MTDTARSRELTLRANALRAEGRWSDALPLAQEAFDADPWNGAAAHNLGVLLTKLGRLAEGEVASRRALEIAPQSAMVAHALAHNLLGQGRLEDGWPLYEARAQLPDLNTGFPTEFPFPRWRGESLAGKRLTIFPEQGLGDQIQFSRFLPRLIAEAESVTLLVMRHLERLFRHNFPDAQFVVADGAVEFPDPDVWTTLHDLPAALNIGLKDLDGKPYLRAPEEWPALGHGFKIGLKTKGNPRHLNDALRSLSGADVDKLHAGLPERIVSLEPGDSGARDMADTAAIIDQLDLIVSVDTSVAHLAGAMGKPCLLLIPGFGPDWRWMENRDDSPWYEGHRLYRSTVDGDWSDAIARLIEDAHVIHRRCGARPLIERAEALGYEGHPAEALAAAQQAVREDPDNVRALYTKAILLSLSGKLPEAEEDLRRIVAAAPELPEARHALGVNLLAQGRYADGWPFYDARTEMENVNDGFPRDFPFPRWQGEDLRGKRVVLFPEQGIGDQIQFVRFVPFLVRSGAQVTLLAPPALKRLFERGFPGLEILSAQGPVDFPDPDYWLTLADLPGRLGIDLSDIPPEPYLRPPGQLSPPGSDFRIGFMAQGGTAYRFDIYRSLPNEVAARLEAELPGTIVSLAPAQSGARDFLDTAAIISGLDLVVSVDTAVAHLAGAMGKPCLLMLPGFATDWRWMRGRETSPWYPHHRLFRGNVDGSWDEAVSRLITEARSLEAAKATRMASEAGRGRGAQPWRGEGLAGKTLIILPDAELTDTIRMARFVPELCRRGADVTWLVAPALAELFRANFPDIHQIEATDAAQSPDAEYVVRLAEVPAALSIEQGAMSGEAYLKPSRRAPELPIGFKTGLALGDEKSLTAKQTARLRAGLPGSIVVLDLEGGGASDYADLAAIIGELDLVVAMDGPTAHLAGAMGKPCLLMIPSAQRERWEAGGDRTPWYPQHRLYREDPTRGWGDTVAALLLSLRPLHQPTRLLTRKAADLRDQGRYSESIEAGQGAVAADPCNATALHNLGRLLTDVGRLEEGEGAERQALAVQPELQEARFGLALNLLAQGRYTEAWPWYEARMHVPRYIGRFPDEAVFPRWRGENIAHARIAVFPEQGFGDHLQFARFLPWLRERCAGVVLLAPLPLVELFRSAFPAIDVHSAVGATSFPKCAVWTTLVELTVLAKATPETLPPGDYLADPATERRVGDEIRIGLMTKGSAAFLHDGLRTLPEEVASTLRARLPGTIVDLDPAISGARNFNETAAIMRDLDLIVSVDTAVGHLAGALGKTCFLLIPGIASDWRWMRQRSDSPWYPHHTLFRGDDTGSWSNAVDALIARVMQIGAPA